MFVNTVRAEWTKLTTTKAFWWTTGLFLGGAVLFGIFELALVHRWVKEAVMSAGDANGFIRNLAIQILLIQAVMVVTTEYRYKLVPIDFTAVPRRWVVMLAKVLLYGLIAAALTCLGLLIAYGMMQSFPNDASRGNIHVFSYDEGGRMLWAMPLAVFLAVFFCQGLGMLMHQTAGAVVVLLLLYTSFTGLPLFIPKYGETIMKILPFQSFHHSITGDPLQGTGLSNWQVWLIWAAWCLVLWIAGLIFVEKRDA